MPASMKPEAETEFLGVVAPKATDAQAARTVFPAIEKLAHQLGTGEAVPMALVDLRLPVSMVPVVARMVEELAEGNMVSASAVEPHAEVTTQEAADRLRISRPTLIRLLDRGEIAYRMAGTHRRVELASLLEYQARVQSQAQPTPSREQKLAALREMAETSHDLGLGY